MEADTSAGSVIELHEVPPDAVQTGPELAPIVAGQRIQALDVIRGFALIGICFMNVEFFNRAQAELGGGIPAGIVGLDWWASWFSNYFVAGKFWTMFSLLFGMGFAVMFGRANEAGRNFMLPYARRIAALAFFGALHHILIWPGDILFSYAVGAVILLFTLFASWKAILGAMLAFLALAMAIKVPSVSTYAVGLGMGGLIALYLRYPRLFTRFQLPLFSLILLIVATCVVLAMLASWFVPAMKDARFPLSVFSFVTSMVTWLSIKYYQPVSQRTWRIGLALFLLPPTIGLHFVTPKYFFPALAMTAPASTPASAPTPAPTSAATPTASAKASASTKATASAKANGKTEKAVDPAAEREAQRKERVKERNADIKEEIEVLKRGRYTEAVKWRAKSFFKKMPEQGVFGAILLGMFLLGTGFVRSGVMQDTRAHLPLFRKLAFVALPLGLMLSVGSSLLATTHEFGMPNPTWDLAWVLLQLSSVPVCLGYVGVLILMLHATGPAAKISLLAPFGRMALTHYLLQSIIASVVFYQYGLGFFGAGRAWQFGYVALLIPCQILVSHWWLSRFAYGPMEWAWRAVTYWNLPPMRLGAA